MSFKDPVIPEVGYIETKNIASSNGQLPAAFGNLTGNFVLEIKLKILSDLTNHTILSKRDTTYTSGTSKGWTLYFQQSGYKFIMSGSNANGTASASMEFAGASVNVDYWLRVTRSGTTCKLYYSTDGITYTQAASSTSATLNGGLSITDDILTQINRRWSSGAWGNYGNVKIYYIKRVTGYSDPTGHDPAYLYEIQKKTFKRLMNYGTIGLAGDGFTSGISIVCDRSNYKDLYKIYPIDSLTIAKESSYADFVTNQINTSTCDIVDLGHGSDTKHIYGLKIGDLDGTKPVLFLLSMIHGNEWENAHLLKWFMDYLDNPTDANADFIGALKSEFDIYCIPCLNAYGYDQNKYYNANGININRNFDIFWDDYNPGEDTLQQKGAEPFDQAETQIVKTLVETYQPVLFVEYHINNDDAGAVDLYLGMKENSDLETYWNTWFQTARFNIEHFCSNISTLSAVDGTKPLSRAWAIRQTSSAGENTIACMVETGGDETDAEITRLQLNATLQLLLDVYKQYTD